MPPSPSPSKIKLAAARLDPTVPLPAGKTEVLSGKTIAGGLKLDRFGFAVVRW